MSTIADTGFYAIVDFTSPTREILRIGYRPGSKVRVKAGYIVVQPLPNLIIDENGAVIRTALEAFLQTLYGYGASLTSSSMKHDLHSAIVDNGLESQYADIEVVDFMAFTGALNRLQTLKNGTQVDLLGLGPDDIRPNLNDLVFKDDFSLMYGIIDHVGVEGIYPYLFVKEGISFDQLAARIKVWKPEADDRKEYVYNTLLGLLRQLRAPVLTEKQVAILIE